MIVKVGFITSYKLTFFSLKSCFYGHFTKLAQKLKINVLTYRGTFGIRPQSCHI